MQVKSATCRVSGRAARKSAIGQVCAGRVITGARTVVRSFWPGSCHWQFAPRQALTRITRFTVQQATPMPWRYT